MGGVVPKQFLSLGGEPLILQSLRTLQAAPVVDQIVLAVPLADVEYCENEIVSRHRLTKVTKVVAGAPSAKTPCDPRSLRSTQRQKLCSSMTRYGHL